MRWVEICSVPRPFESVGRAPHGKESRLLPDAEALALKGFMARRRQLVAMLVAERNRLDRALPPVCSGIEEHIVWLEDKLRELNRELNHTL